MTTKQKPHQPVGIAKSAVDYIKKHKGATSANIMESLLWHIRGFERNQAQQSAIIVQQSEENVRLRELLIAEGYHFNEAGEPEKDGE